MPHDVAYRSRTALDPSAITTIAASLHIVTKAIEDCKRAGVTFDQDPAVLLLTQHLGKLASSRATNGSNLRVRCMQAIGAIEASPSLRAIAASGVAGYPDAKAAFHSEARTALKRFAEAFGYGPYDYELRTIRGGHAVGGNTVLHSNNLYVQVSPECCGPSEVMFRRCRNRSDYHGMSSNWASLAELDNPQRLANRIRRELGFPRPVHVDLTLFA
ncbi:MAG: hypothetical protein WA979_05930 [Pacificimonas sp.]